MMKLKMRTREIILLFTFSTLIALFSISLYLTTPKYFVSAKAYEVSDSLLFSFERVRYPSNATVIKTEDNVIGFDIDKENLNFGLMQAGGSGQRFIDIANTYDQEAKVRLSAYGNMSKFISFSDNNFVLRKNENQTIAITFRTDNTTTTGVYTGEIDLTVVRPKSSFGNLVLWMA
jgi:hypothetical protein